MPILPEHIWSEIDEDELHELPQRARLDPRAGVGCGPFVLRGTSAGQFVPLRRERRLLAGRPHIDGVEFRLYQQRRRHWSRRSRTVRSTSPTTSTPTSSQALEGEEDIEAQMGGLAGLRRARDQRRRGGPVDGNRIGDGHPRCRTRVPAGDQLRAWTGKSSSTKAYQAGAVTGRASSRARIPMHCEPPRTRRSPTTPTGAGCSTRRATRWAGRLPHHAGRLGHGPAAAVRAQQRRDRPSGRWSSSAEWLADLGIASTVSSLSQLARSPA